jgi:2-polyprenyl-6-methoxyphenol hydroxylase-like FAD-dependent oxidoreductase
MLTGRYDAIVVGARCAGAPTAMLLARKGWNVLLVDRATFPSDTISTHLIHPQGVAALARWGLRDRLVATGCPPIDTYTFDFGPITFAGSPAIDGSPVAYCPRRTILDKLLVDAAREAGIEVREGFAVEEITVQDDRVTGIVGHGTDGAAFAASAPVVIGADGRHSRVARAVRPVQYHEKPELQVGYYAYWSGLPQTGRFGTFLRDRRGGASIPTHDGQTIVIAGWPIAEFAANKRDLERNYLATLEQVDDLWGQLKHARRESTIYGGSVPNFFRKPYGPGWVLVGDAGYTKDPITAQGISDAFRDAELVASALDAVSSGARSFDDAMAAYQATRDAAVLPTYEFTCQLATMEPPPPEMLTLFGAMIGDRAKSDRFCRVVAGTASPAELFV